MTGRPLPIGPALHVLHVDDHAINRRLVREILGCFGHEVTDVGSGDEALDLARHRAFDLVLMDINMPGMSGIEVVRRLSAIPCWDRDTPVIALTSEVSRTLSDYIALGFSGYVPKPTTIAELMQAVDQCVKKHAAGPLVRRVA
ncbi:response regulator [Phenylobacterium sp.]|uniref:response regulator n=1 Tax=Phenylobacterium sp. TaxID=1871053 RepID=UPI0011F9BBDC|nr:response regulator [Phenylobacterium sp.]THD63912.1 MAG: response regulator [Phenylobacterium sp.]